MSIKDSFSKIAKSVEGGAKSVVKGVGGGAKSVAKKSGDIVETSKLNRELAAEEEKITKIYFEIGKAVFEGYEKDEAFDEEVLRLCREIEDIKENILKLKERLAFLKDLKVCPNCKTELDISIAFCPICGTKQIIPVKEEVQEESTEGQSRECEECDCHLKGEEDCPQNCGPNKE